MRWFGDAYWDLFLNAAQVVGRHGVPFPDVLFQMIADPATEQKGKLFEAATALLFSATPGFEVRSARKTLTSRSTSWFDTSATDWPFCRWHQGRA